MEVSDYLSFSRENEVIVGRSVLFLTAFFFVFFFGNFGIPNPCKISLQLLIFLHD